MLDDFTFDVLAALEAKMLNIWLACSLNLFNNFLRLIQGDVNIEDLEFVIIHNHLFQILGLGLILDVLLANLDQVNLELNDRD